MSSRAQAQQLGRGDEGQALHRVLVVHPGTRTGSGQRAAPPALLVEAQCRGRYTGALGQLRDAVGRHTTDC